MNSKLFKASIAGVAAITLAATGSTFAAWSDLGTVSANKTDAGHLKLDLNGTGAITNVGGTPIAPGEYRTIDQLVGSADLAGVYAGALSMKVVNLVDQENGCGSSTSEAAVDDCANPASVGEFSKEAYVRVRYSNPAPMSQITFAGNNCTAPSGLVNAVGYAMPSNNDNTVYPRLSALALGNSALGTLLPGQGICLRVDLGLGQAATNAVQSDSSTFDVQFDLAQVFTPQP